MYLPPIVRISEKKHLEDLQNGKLFMRNVQYYQQLESEDLARSDPFDGAIPAIGVIPKVLEGNPVTSQLNPETSKFTYINTYVSCFFGIRWHQVDSSGRITLSPSIVNKLREFICKDAIIIELNRLTKRLQRVMEQEQPSLIYGHVEYLTNQDYDVELTNLIKNMPPSRPFEFLKRDSFAQQQEFRISCRYNDDIYQKLCVSESQDPARHLSHEMLKQIADSSITIDIGSIQEFSKIIKLSDLLEGRIGIRMPI